MTSESNPSPPEKPTTGYYFAVPRDDDDCLDGLTYEIVYLYFDGKWSVVRAGMSGLEPMEQWNLLRKIGSPHDH